MKNSVVFNKYIDNILSCTPEEAIKLADKIGDRDLWALVLKQSNVIEFLNKKTPEAVIELTKDFGYLVAWKAWKTVLDRSDIIEFLNNKTPEEAIKLAKRIGNEPVWQIVIKRKDISPKEAFDIAKEVKNDLFSLFSTILERSDVKEFLNAKTLLGHERFIHNYYSAINERYIAERLRESVLERGDIKEILKNSPLKEAIKMAIKIGCVRGWRTIFERNDTKDFFISKTPKEIKKILEKFWGPFIPGVNEIAELILELNGIKESLANKKLDEAIKLAREIDSGPFWGIILSRKDVPTEKLTGLKNEFFNKYVRHGK